MSKSDPLRISEQLRQYSTPDIADALTELGYTPSEARGIKRMWDDCPRIAGKVIPVALGPDYAESTVIGTRQAIKDAEPGAVLVFANESPKTNSFGSLAAFCATRAGVNGVICDGASRDIDDIRAQNMPLYASGRVTTSVRGTTGYGGHNIPIDCAGVTVNPGDYVVADGSGVIFIPAHAIPDVLDLAPRFDAYEREMKQRIIDGADIVELHETFDYDEFIEQYNQ